MTRIICGVDVASKSLEARIGQQGAAASFPNTPQGIAALGEFCQAHQVELVAMEATGGYEQQAFALLSQQGLPAAILNPRAVRQFAESMGSLEKTDRIDAGMIAWYADVKKSRPACLAPQSQQHLRALVTRLRQLTDIRTAQLNQQRLVTDRSVQASFTKLLAFVNRQICDLEQRIAKLIEQDPLWRELNQAFRTIKGVADRTVARMMAENAGGRHLVQQNHFQAGRSGAAGPRFGQVPGQTCGARRPRLGPRSALHCGQCCGPL